ncbi:hypothetical protein [Streptomyces cucumeris]|uniref:hypothetical protein n=1 Tax=Streptomyces cucumeris TaxID=2962890 RepID=UPI003D734AE5
MNDELINALIGGGFAVITTAGGLVGGWWWSHRQQREADVRQREADAVRERERLLEQMQHLVVAVGELHSQRTLHREIWQSRWSQVRMWTVIGAEALTAWSRGGCGWTGAMQTYGPTIRTLDRWSQRTLDGAAALAPYMAKVGAAGLPLGMVEDPTIAAAAQRLMDAALEDKSEDEIDAAVAALRAAFYPEEPDGARRRLPE